MKRSASAENNSNDIGESATKRLKAEKNSDPSSAIKSQTSAIVGSNSEKIRAESEEERYRNIAAEQHKRLRPEVDTIIEDFLPSPLEVIRRAFLALNEAMISGNAAVIKERATEANYLIRTLGAPYGSSNAISLIHNEHNWHWALAIVNAAYRRDYEKIRCLQRLDLKGVPRDSNTLNSYVAQAVKADKDLTATLLKSISAKQLEKLEQCDFFYYLVLLDKTHRENLELLAAAERGDYEKCEQLILEHGANVNSNAFFYMGNGDIDFSLGLAPEETPLAIAAMWDHVRICELLIDNGADVNGTDFYAKDGDFIRTALREAEPQACRLLISKGANVHAEGEHEYLNLAFEKAIEAEEEFEDSYFEKAQILIENGVEVNNFLAPSKSYWCQFLRDYKSRSTCEDTAIRLMMPHVFLIPPVNEEQNSTALFNTILCTLNRVGLFRLKDLQHIILASDNDANNPVVQILLRRIHQHASNGTLKQALRGIPLRFHTLICKVIYEYTMAFIESIKSAYPINTVRAEFGDRIFQNIVKRLDADIAAFDCSSNPFRSLS